MASDLKTLFETRIPAGQSLMLVVLAPLNNVRGMKSEIKLHIEEVVELGYANRLININGDAASITIHETNCKTFQGVLISRYLTMMYPPMLERNVIHSLRERMSGESWFTRQAAHSGDEYWLCMLNEIWLAKTHVHFS